MEKDFLHEAKVELVSELGDAITKAIENYTARIITGMKSLSISELADVTPKSAPRTRNDRPTQSPPPSMPVTTRFPYRVTSPEKIADRILQVLSENPTGLPTHRLRDAVNASQSDYAKAIIVLGERIRKEGQKRGSVYSLNTATPTGTQGSTATQAA